MLAFEKSQPFGGTACGMTFLSSAWGLRSWVTSHPCWRNLTFTMDCICWAKRADSFIEQKEPVGARSSTSWLVSFGEMFIFCNFEKARKMGSDFIASILRKCHKIRAIERFLQVGFLFPKSFKWSHWGRFSAHGPSWEGTTLGNLLSVTAACTFSRRRFFCRHSVTGSKGQRCSFF